jgi:hypothetical protein
LLLRVVLSHTRALRLQLLLRAVYFQALHW